MAGFRPQPFGKYVLVHRLAMGGMAEIFLAKQGSVSFQGFERFIVIKRILPNLSENEDFVRMFLDEARLAAQLNHPNIVQIYDIGAVDGQYFISMEYLSGRDTRRLMKKAAKRAELIPLPFALQIVHGICEGLEYAHSKTDQSGRPLSIVHRDVSPQNVHVTVDGAVKVLDFGIAKAESQMVETRAGVLKGKYSYMSPEQASGAKVDRRSDIFALGILLFEMTTGRRLFKTDNEMQTLRAVIEAGIPHPVTLLHGYPPELDRIVMRALARPLGERYQSCREMQADIEMFMVSRGIPLTAARLGNYVRELTRDEPDPTRLPEVQGGAVPLTGDDEDHSGPEEVDVDLLDSLDEPPSVGTPSKELLTGSSPGSGASNASGVGSFSAAQEVSGSRSSLSVMVGQRPALSIGIASVLVALVTAGVVLWLVPATRADGADTRVTTPQNPWPTVPVPGVVPPVPTPASILYGALQVTSVPAGARVVFDGQDRPEPTPTIITEVTVGEPHSVVVISGDSPPQSRTVRLSTDGQFETLDFRFATESRDGGVAARDGGAHPPVGVKLVAFSLRTEPPTKVVLDSRTLGQSPISTRVSPGSHVLRLTDSANQINYTTSIRVADGQPFSTTIAIPRGTLKVNVLPWANVTVNGRPLGQTPIPPRPVFAGRYSVRIENPTLNRSETQIVTVPPNGAGVLARDWRN
ncbi:MAG: serine/threonine protein kinase [Deltaproteobacteria bacterium]|nr:serine/threonine protein kinase [Deltaproteobacteria bacterium]